MFRSEDKLRRAVVFLSGRSSEDDDVLYSALKPVLRPPKRTLDASIVDFVWSDVGTVTFALRPLQRLPDHRYARRRREDDGGCHRL